MMEWLTTGWRIEALTMVGVVALAAVIVAIAIWLNHEEPKE
jgi:hypothetical protein